MKDIVSGEIKQCLWYLVEKKQEILELPVVFHQGFHASQFVVGRYKNICSKGLIVKIVNKL